MINSLEVDILRSAAELEGERRLWAVWPGCRDSDLDFYLMILRSRPEVLAPHALVLYRDKQARTILLGRVEQRRLDLRVGYLRFFRPQARILSFIAGGLRGDESKESCRTLLGEVMHSLRRGESDVAILANLNFDSPICQLATQLPGHRCRDHFPTVDVHWKMDLTGDFESVRRRLSSDHRAQLGRKERKLLAAFKDEVQVVCYSDPSSIGRAMQDVEEVAQKTYQRGLGVGFCLSDEMRNRFRLQADLGWLRVYVLFLRGAPCAFWVGSLYNGIFYSDYLGHDPAYDRHSIGTFLTMRTISALCDEGAKSVDFGPGDSRYKQQFGNSRSEESTVYLFAPTAKGLVLNVARSFSILIDRVLKYTLGRVHLRSRFKRYLRKNASERARLSVPPGDKP